MSRIRNCIITLLLAGQFFSTSAHALIDLPNPFSENLALIPSEVKNENPVTDFGATLCGVVGASAGGLMGAFLLSPISPEGGLYLGGITGNVVAATTCSLAFLAVEIPMRSVFTRDPHRAPQQHYRFN